MKKISSLIAVALIALAGSVQALDIQTVVSGTTNSVYSSRTNSYSTVIPVVKASNAGFGFSGVLLSAGTGNTTVVMDSSADNVTWKVGSHTIVFAMNGTTSVTAVTNMTLGALGYLRLSSIINANTNTLTNIVFKVSTKTGL